MSEYTVNNIKYLETSRGVAFTASLFLDGKKTGVIENYGDGGPTFCRECRELSEDFLDNLMDIAEGVVS